VIECVPNVSEGRDPAVIADIARAPGRTGCRLLDVHSDPDHHRSVVTFVGDAKQVESGAIALAARAIALIDLRNHRGAHPRIGAVDVIPVVPLKAERMDECRAVARRIGHAIADRLGLPVYLYGAAASTAQRTSLAWMRRGGFEGLSKTLAESAPDFGPRTPHPTAGAVAVGARHPLVAFNIVLATADVAVASRIASAVRERDGGLPGVQALGMWLASKNLAQVSMNLTDLRVTSIPDVFRTVEREASQWNVKVHESEIVGLVPESALGSASAAGLRMASDPRDHILEHRLEEPTS
jgi:glutamate formiminotransferase